MQRDRHDAKMDPPRLPVVLNRLEISRSGLLFDVNENLLCFGMRTARGRKSDKTSVEIKGPSGT